MGSGSNIDVAIIGGGIIGTCVAAFLAEAGRKVTIIDRSGICEETSSGNAAALAFSDVLPMAHKGMMRSLPKWLLDPLGPLSIPPSYLPRLLPWLLRFWRAGAPANYERSLAAQAGMMRLAETEWSGLMQRSATAGMLRENGSLELYDSEGGFQAALPGWEARERFGIEHRHLDSAGIAELQPGLSPRFVRGTFVPGWKTVSNPKPLGKAIWRHAQDHGSELLLGEVALAVASDGRIAIQLKAGRTVLVDSLVIAAGAWSHRLARHFGDRIPLETERGYNTTLPKSAFDLKRMLVFPDHGFVIPPLDDGIRVGGAVELAGLDRPPNFARSSAMLQKAARFLPDLDPSGGRQWMGFRPSLPDSLPVIGHSARQPGVFYAFGHGHLGLTQSAATGRLIRDLVLGQAPALDLQPFSPQRF